jgi:hypothetical protein
LFVESKSGLPSSATQQDWGDTSQAQFSQLVPEMPPAQYPVPPLHPLNAEELLYTVWVRYIYRVSVPMPHQLDS